jgi:glycosyltransferase involved in cell wall biosynthesis
MKKVLRITNSLDFGGIEKVFELHGKYFDKKHYELVFVAMHGGGHTEELLKNLGYRVFVLHTRIKIPSMACILTLCKLFLHERPDVVHTCGAEANFHGIIAATLLRVPTIVAEEIGLPNHSSIARKVYKGLYHFCSRVIAISDAVRDYLVKHEATPGKVVRIYNPIELSGTNPAVMPPGREVIISSLCRLEPIKNCKMLIKLVSSLKKKFPDRSFILWLIGDGSERRMLEQLALQEGVDTNVKFWGYRKDAHQVLIQSNVFVLASLKEGFGLAAIEAIQASLPVVVSNSGGMVEFIRDGDNGFLFDPQSLDELLYKTETLLSLSNQDVLRLTGRAHETVRQMFSPFVYLEELLALYARR